MAGAFYDYWQSNPGGRYDGEIGEGTAHCIFIEADSAEKADAIAETLGVYFDGIALDIDCECCNDRWYRAMENPRTEAAVRDYCAKEMGALNCGREIDTYWVVFRDGRIEKGPRAIGR